LLGYIRRNAIIQNTSVRRALYLTLVRPHIGYASQIWSPQFINLIARLEKVQRRATKFILNMRKLAQSECIMLRPLHAENFTLCARGIYPIDRCVTFALIFSDCTPKQISNFGNPCLVCWFLCSKDKAYVVCSAILRLLPPNEAVI
jgi:hypothetical protein